MSNQTSVVDTASPQVSYTPSAALPRRSRSSRAYAELATRLFDGPKPLTIVAFVSVNRGEGVTTTLRGTADELVRSGKNTVILDGSLRTLFASGNHLSDVCEERLPRLFSPKAALQTSGGAQDLGQIRERYDAILLDCGALDVSVDLLRLAPVVDAVVLVVEAGRTRKDQIERATKLVHNARGRLAGIVLNKRRYPIPGWLYRLL